MLALEAISCMSLAFSNLFYAWACLSSSLNQSGILAASFSNRCEYCCLVSTSRSFRLYLNSFSSS